MLVDDGSTDGSSELAEAFAARHPYLHREALKQVGGVLTRRSAVARTRV